MCCYHSRCLRFAAGPRDLLTLFTLFGALPYLAYVIRLGGDFMLGRLIVPLLPLVALLAEQGVSDLTEESAAAPPLLAVLLLALAVAPVRLIDSMKQRWFIADERTYYGIAAFSPHVVLDDSERARALTDLVSKDARPIVAEIPIGLEGYESDLEMIDLVGLTDRAIAHQPPKAADPAMRRWRAPRICDHVMSISASFRCFPARTRARR